MCAAETEYEPAPDGRVRRALILGGGTAGWMAALALRRFLPQLDVTVVYAPDVPTIGVGEATTASLPPFLHNDLALDRCDFYRRVSPSWKLGIRFLWGRPEKDDGSTYEFAYPFRCSLECPDVFAPSNAHFALPDYDRASLFAELMRRRRAPLFNVPHAPRHFEEAFGYHFDATALNAYLQSVAAARGATIVDGKFAAATRRGDGSIASIRLDDGRSLEADLFLDSSGFASLLVGKSLAEPFVGFEDSLFCDRAVVGSWRRDDEPSNEHPRDDEILPYTTAQTMRAGWCWRIDLPNRVSRGYVYASAFADDDEAEAELRRENPRIDGPVRVVPFRSGRYRRTWINNVVAIGNASGFVEPLESTGLHMAMETITAVCRALIDTDRRIVPAMCDVVNRFLGEMWDDVRAFLAVHFRFNNRCESPFWRHCRENVNLAAAESLVEFYRRVGPTRIGHVYLPPQSVFGHRGYLALFVGQAVPTDFRFSPSPQELESWRQHLANVSAAADASLDVREALQLAAAGQIPSPPAIA